MTAQEIIDEAISEQKRIDGIKRIDSSILQGLNRQGIEIYWDGN